MKKIFKIIILLLCLVTHVKAKEYSESFLDKVEWISGDYVIKQKGSSKKYQQMYTIKRKSDNKFIYCIEPGVSIKEGKVVIGYDDNYLDVTKFTSEQWDRITKLAYYGYGYKDSKYDHTGIHWYTITQFMIWKTVPNGYDIYFTDKLNGKRITKYAKEMNEMEEILNNYHKLTSFNDNTYTFGINNEKKVIDDNNVISSFIPLTKASDYSINNNQVNFNINSPGEYNYEFTKANNKYGYLPIVYIDSASQNLMSVGDVVDDSARVTIKVIGGNMIGHKLDYDTMGNTPQGDGSLSGAIYGIYDENNNLVQEVTTNDKGEFRSNYLNYGNYYIKEIKPSLGYLLDDTKYSFSIDDSNKEPTITLFEKVITGKLEIIKYFSSNNHKELEEGAKFAIYDKNNNLYKEAITDIDG
jgi:outer membrane lipoprotein-sorting protein